MLPDEPLRFSNWEPDEPNGQYIRTGTAHDCVSLDAFSGAWKDADCRDVKAFVCRVAKCKLLLQGISHRGKIGSAETFPYVGLCVEFFALLGDNC